MKPDNALLGALGSFFSFVPFFYEPSSPSLDIFFDDDGFVLKGSFLDSFFTGFSFSPPLSLASDSSPPKSSLREPSSSLSATKTSSSSSLSSPQTSFLILSKCGSIASSSAFSNTDATPLTAYVPPRFMIFNPFPPEETLLLILNAWKSSFVPVPFLREAA